jgi:putative transposase
MKRSKFSEEQIVFALRQAEAGTPVGDLCRQLGVSNATFYAGKKKYAHLGVSELRRLRQLDEENSRLKRLMADLSLDEHMLSEALREKVYDPPAAASPPSGFRRRFRLGVREPAGWRNSVGRPGIAAVKRGTNRPSACGFGTLLSAIHDLGICGSGCSCVGKAGG